LRELSLKEYITSYNNNGRKISLERTSIEERYQLGDLGMKEDIA
jgi:hypothetical protein